MHEAAVQAGRIVEWLAATLFVYFSTAFFFDAFRPRRDGPRCGLPLFAGALFLGLLSLAFLPLLIRWRRALRGSSGNQAVRLRLYIFLAAWVPAVIVGAVAWLSLAWESVSQ